MSELEKKTEEAPKRKRRTKAELEEAKKNGTYKPRKKVVKEEVPNETKAPEEHAAKAPMKPEQSVLIMACLTFSERSDLLSSPKETSNLCSHSPTTFGERQSKKKFWEC